MTDKPSATPLQLHGAAQDDTGLAGLGLIVGTFIAFAGLEVNAVHIRSLAGRPKTYLPPVGLAVCLILLMYIPGSIAISVAVPSADLDFNAGAAQAFEAFAGGFGISGIGRALCGLLVVGAAAASLPQPGGFTRLSYATTRTDRQRSGSRNSLATPQLGMTYTDQRRPAGQSAPDLRKQ